MHPGQGGVAAPALSLTFNLHVVGAQPRVLHVIVAGGPGTGVHRAIDAATSLG
jgi:hypothetical protein